MFDRIEEWLWQHPRLIDYMTVLVPFLFICLIGFLSSGCSTLKEVPVQQIEKIEYRDSLIYIRDTVTLEIPKEVTREVIPQLDTSYLSTSLATSTAYLDTAHRKIHHTLQQRGTIQTKIDTVVKVQYTDRYIEKEVPVEVEVIKYKRDTLFWVSLALNLIVLIILGLKITA